MFALEWDRHGDGCTSILTYANQPSGHGLHYKYEYGTNKSQNAQK